MRNEPGRATSGVQGGEAGERVAVPAPVGQDGGNAGPGPEVQDPAWGSKVLEASTLRDDGYLQEVNRGFFHPLGLALELDTGTGILRILDFRDDPGGVMFPWTVDTETLATRLAAIRIARQPARIRELGFWQQPTSKGSNQADVRDAAGKS
jgi:hypothetical protein